MPNRVASILVGTLLAAAPVACETQQASKSGAEAKGEAKKPVTDASPAGSPSAAPPATAPKDAPPTPDSVTPAPKAVEPPAEAAVPRAVRVVRTVTVGKWPEDVAVLGDDAFVATSGSRIVRRVDLATGNIEQSIKAGTFPVSIVTGAEEVWTADYDSRRTLFQIDASGKATKRGKLPDHVEKLAFGDGLLFALIGKDSSDTDSSVVRFDPKTGEQQRSVATGDKPGGLAVGHGRVWAAAGGGVVVLSPEDLAIQARIPVAARQLQLFTNGTAVYAASFSDGKYFRIEPTKLEVTGTVEVGEEFVMAVNDDRVVTLGHSGTLAIWDPKDGSERAKLSVGIPIKGQWMTWYGSGLVVTAHGASDDVDGSLHVLALE